MIKLKFKSEFFKSSNKFIFYIFFDNFFSDISKCLKIYQLNFIKKIKKARDRYQSFSKEEKKKKWQYGCERQKNSSEEKKNKRMLSIEKKLQNEKKRFIIITKKYYFK